MSPAHMASTAAVMEVLYKFEADIDMLDGNMRSPLFVSCAMNREDVADFVVNCLDHSDMVSGGYYFVRNIISIVDILPHVSNNLSFPLIHKVSLEPRWPWRYAAARSCV